MRLAVLLLSCTGTARETDFDRAWVHRLVGHTAGYFLDQSGGRVDIEFRVLDWFELPHTSQQWNDLGFGAGPVVTPMVSSELNVDLSAFDPRSAARGRAPESQRLGRGHAAAWRRLGRGPPHRPPAPFADVVADRGGGSDPGSLGRDQQGCAPTQRRRRLGRWENGWHPGPLAWEPLGGLFSSSAAVVSWAPGRLDVFALGKDARVWHKAWAQRWHPSETGWEALGGGFV
jgi:hypothetical protein